VRKDVEVSFRKVRPGGIIAGDDFFWKKDGRTHVKEAVLDAMKDRGITTSPPRIGQQFMITVPE
jgi:predicted O-methyltransferase YrrM